MQVYLYHSFRLNSTLMKYFLLASEVLMDLDYLPARRYSCQLLMTKSDSLTNNQAIIRMDV